MTATDPRIVPPTITTITGIRYDPRLLELFSNPKRSHVTFIVSRDPPVSGRTRRESTGPDRVYGPEWARPMAGPETFSLLNSSIGTAAYVDLNLQMDRAAGVCLTLDFLDKSLTMYPLRIKHIGYDALSWFSQHGIPVLNYTLKRCGIDFIAVSGPALLDESATDVAIKKYRRAELIAKEYAHRLGYLMDTVYVTIYTDREQIIVGDTPMEGTKYDG